MEPVFDGWPPGGPGAREPVGHAIKGERVDVKSQMHFFIILFLIEFYQILIGNGFYWFL